MPRLKIAAELNATVSKIEIEKGARVESDATLLLLESMKVEIPVTAPRAGMVAEILVAEGETIKEGQTLFILET
jgi:acetyl-CoA carboxylase biotin carboxyl carrier protein